MIALSYEVFCQKFTEQVQVMLGENYALKREQAIGYNATQKDVFLVHKKESCCMPRFDLGAYYENYIEGIKIEELAKKVVFAVTSENLPTEETIKEMFCKEQIQERVIVRVFNRKANEQLLKEMPYLPFLDLAITFHLLIEEGKDGTKSVRITKKIWEEYIELPLLEMYRQALCNTERLFPAHMEQLETILQISENGVNSGLFIVSNQYGIYGAAALLYNGIQEKMEQVLGGRYYVIPSSVHEVLVIQETDVPDVELLKNTILEVNRTQVGAEDILSNQLYRFDGQQLVCVE